MLEVVRNGKIAYFLLIILNLSANNPNSIKATLNQYPNPDILIIPLPKNDKMLVMAKTSLLTICPISAMEINYIKMQW